MTDSNLPSGIPAAPPPPPYGAPNAAPVAGQPQAGQPSYTYQNTAPTNTLAILSLIAAFVVAPAGIVLGHLALGQIRRTGEQGNGLAKAGLILSYIFTGLWVIGIVIWIIVALALASLGVAVTNVVPGY